MAAFGGRAGQHAARVQFQQRDDGGVIEPPFDMGRDTLFDIDWQGGQQIRSSALGRDVVSIFVLPPSMTELERRLLSRAQDGKEVVKKRMASAGDEMSHWPEYDYVLVNRDFDDSVRKVEAIVQAERLRRARQVGLAAFVRKLRGS